MINAICLDVATKLQNCKKMHSRYVYVTHTCLDVATKPEKLQKKELMIYVALAAKPENHKKIFNFNFNFNFKIAKKCIHDMFMLLTHV